MDYYGYDEGLMTGILAGFGIMFIIFLLIGIILSIISTIGTWKVFKKAGQSGWKSLIPFYSTWVLMEIAGLNWWWFLIGMSTTIFVILGFDSLSFLASIASIFAMFNCNYNLAKRFNKSTGFAVCLTLFPAICMPILGLSKNSKYDGSIPVSKNGCIGPNEDSNFNTSNLNNVNTSSNMNENDYSFCASCGTKMDKDVRFCPNCGREKN